MSFFDDAAKWLMGDESAITPEDIYFYHQQGACYVKVYHQDNTITELFWEILECDSERSIENIGAPFNITLLPSQPFDELIQPGDYVRIFYGDRVNKTGNGASIDLGYPKIPVPNAGPVVKGMRSIEGTTNEYTGNLLMRERCFGIVDRCERMVRAPAKNQGRNCNYVVTGRFFGAFMQDMTIYYNEFVGGLNAINTFWGSMIKTDDQSPDQIVKSLLTALLTSIPLPQWRLPSALVEDYASITGEFALKNIADAVKDFAEAAARIVKTAVDNFKESLDPISAVTDLRKLAQTMNVGSPQSLLNVMSLDGIKNCYGKAFNASFLNSVTTGVQDYVRSMSNSFMNELFCDLCPNGDAYNADKKDSKMVPTLVMRQRPYDITEQILTGACGVYNPFKQKYKKYAETELKSSINLVKLLHTAIDIIGPISKPYDPSNLLALKDKFSHWGEKELHGSPMLLDYRMGISGRERLNGFFVGPQYATGQANQGSDRVLMAENGGLIFDIDSIEKYGFRVKEMKSTYAVPSSGLNPSYDHTQIAVKMSKTIANWYFLNPVFLSGTMTTRFLDEARLGVPVRYFETAISPDNPYPKMEVSYCAGVRDHFKLGQPLTTTLTCIRGIRYNLADNASDAELVGGFAGIKGKLLEVFG